MHERLTEFGTAARAAVLPQRPRPVREPTPVPPLPKVAPGSLPPKVETLLSAITQLVEILTAENDALRRYDVEAVKALTPRKIKSTRFYQEQMVGVHGNPRMLLDLSEEHRAVLREAGATLDALAQENGRRLKANIEAGKRLMKGVVEAVREQERERATRYAPDGTMDGEPMDAQRKSVTYNKTL
ncbi:hypothetical protein ROR02_19170 [Pararhodospirillum oryzae]|uniref:Flagellar basal-body protein FlbY n=1 Tax=Pararhodospirillum oryzae TaxID=478448 RepID=A0A512H8K2_9PROT|nr:hypothetical protein ROR02_19170 [Pararhodospirillum oryzae]